MNLELANTLKMIAEEAAKVVMEVYDSPFDVDYKAPRDPVTEADRRANTLICRRLSEVFPGTPIVAEESDPETFRDFQRAPGVFFVDPVDGTREFIAKNGEFVIMIGYVTERAVAGVVHAPAKRQTWWGQLGQGAFFAEDGAEPRPITPSQTLQLTDATIVASRSHRSAEMERVLQALNPRKLLALGSAGLKGAVIADGTADAYVSPHYAGKRWDCCAVDAIVTAAGGVVTDAYGERIDYRSSSLGNDRGLVAAATPTLHGAILSGLAGLREA